MKLSHSRRLTLSLCSLAIATAVWYAVARSVAQPELFPDPYAVLKEFIELLGTGVLESALWSSLSRVAIGYVAGSCAGVLTGVVLGRVPLLARSFGPVFDFLKGIPPIALIPILVVWFGVGETSKYLVIAYIVWIVVAVSVMAGCREIPLIRLRAAAFLGLSARATFFHVILPSLRPYVLSGMRSAIGFAFVALVSAELLAANSGIGHIIMDARFSLQTAKMLAGILCLGALGALLQWGFDALTERRSRQRVRP